MAEQQHEQPAKKPRKLRRPRRHGDGSVFELKDRTRKKRWVAQITLETGKKKQTYHTSEQEALAACRKMLHELEQGTLVTARQQSLQVHMEQWLRAKRLKLKRGTYQYYRVYTRRYIIPALGNIRLQKLTDAHIQAFYADLIEDEDLSPNTVRLIHAILRGALKAAVRSNKIASNPCELVTLPRAVKKELAYLTFEQAQQLLGEARNHKLEYLLATAVITGMRLGELLALRWSDIDFAQATVHVTRSLSYRDPDGTGYTYEEEEPKTASSRRTIPLPDFLIELLAQHRIRQLERRLQAAEWEDKGLVFPNYKGGYLWADPMREQFGRLLQEAKLPPLRFHDLRHSAATILLALGVNPKVVAEWLGHGDVSTTLRVYGHVTESMRREATTKLDDQFKRLKGGQN
jgi:integrase